MGPGFESGIKIGDAAVALGVTPRTIRFYEGEGLLQAQRSPGGTRYYRELEVQRLRAILALASAGIPIEDIRNLAGKRGQHATGNRASHAVGADLEALETECCERITALKRAVAALRDAEALVRQCRGCRRQPDSEHCPDCPVKQARARVPMASLIWDQGD